MIIELLRLFVILIYLPIGIGYWFNKYLLEKTMWSGIRIFLYFPIWIFFFINELNSKSQTKHKGEKVSN